MEERIDTNSDPRLVLEHVARYRFAAPAVTRGDLWIDLGCGAGVAAREALAGRIPDRVVLVEKDPVALSAARDALPGSGVEALELDLASSRGLEELERHLSLGAVPGACVTCFEVIEHLDDFSTLIAALVRLAAEHSMTVVLSVPNDSFWSMHNPHHRTMWGGEAFEEFRALLPADHLVAHQLSLGGTCIVPRTGVESASFAPGVDATTQAVPSHYIVAFGAAASTLEPVAGLVQADLDQQRAWERQREADLAYYAAEVERLQAELDDLRDPGHSSS